MEGNRSHESYRRGKDLRAKTNKFDTDGGESPAWEGPVSANETYRLNLTRPRTQRSRAETCRVFWNLSLCLSGLYLDSDNGPKFPESGLCARMRACVCVCRGVNRCLLSTLSAVPLSAECFSFTDFSGKSVLAFHMKCGQEARSQSVSHPRRGSD